MRKALVVSTYEEFQSIGREKLGLGKAEPIRVVLESDGTQVHTKVQTILAYVLFLYNHSVLRRRRNVML